MVTAPMRNELRRAVETERCWLAILTGPQLPRLRELLTEAHERQRRDPAFVAEWAWWTARDQDTADGVPVSSSGPLPEPRDRWVLRDFSAGRARPRVAGKDFEPEPLIAAVGSFHDHRLARLQAGQAMQRVLLGGGLWPQTLLRIGYGSPVPRTPRRPVTDVLEPAVDGHPVPD